MTRPQDDPFDDAPEADVAEQRAPADPSEAADEPADDVFRDADRVADERDWQASEADLIEQTIEVPIDDDFDR